MDELYTLEREEALRRAEYEARHAEALRRVSQRESRQSVRLSKSATTSPVATPLPSLSSGTSSERDSHSGAGENIKPADRTKRRMSGPAWQMTPVSHEPSLGHPHTSGHVIETPSSVSLQAHGVRQPTHWSGHPYQSSTYPHPHSQYRHLTRQDDSPSPLSSDSDSLPPLNSVHSPSHPFSTQTHGIHTSGISDSKARPSEFAFTPSTSPFLGPLRTLNLHSANPSRAPSPILLPPPSMNNGVNVDRPTSPMEESPRAYGPQSRIVGSPPKGSLHGWHTSNRRKTPGDDRHHLLPSQTYPAQLSHLVERGASSLHTPQLSSGASSDSSSPRSSSYSLGIAASAPFHLDSGSGTPSAANSRPPSPSQWQPSSHSSHHARDNSGGTSNHLAHSVRKAFGMTPINPLPRNTSWPSSFSTQAHSVASTPAYPSIFSASMPSSRSGSPPITLPPLKMSSALPSPSRRTFKYDDDDGETVTKGVHPSERLPGFSEFEAASCAPSNR